MSATDARLTCAPGELALIVPLVGALLCQSSWPAGISDRPSTRDCTS